MPWFPVDDSAHSHPKFMKAKNAAIGLWVRCGSYVAQYLTDGIVPGPVAELYGTAPQIKKLVEVGLWHAHGHTCPRCPQPTEGDFYMHDYAAPGSGNLTRAEVEERRAKAAEKKRRQRAGGQRPPQPPGRRPLPSDGPDEQPGFDFDEADDYPPEDSPAAEPRRAPSRGRSLIPADWEPSEDDIAAAQQARLDAGLDQLTRPQLAAVTRKFVRRQLDDQVRAAAWGGRWQRWAETERTDQQDGVVVRLDAHAHGRGQTEAAPTRGQQQREGLRRLYEQAGEV
ncbi:hypothetical protein AB0H29_08270 [Streptomyces thermolilacinus]